MSSVNDLTLGRKYLHLQKNKFGAIEETFIEDISVDNETNTVTISKIENGKPSIVTFQQGLPQLTYDHKQNRVVSSVACLLYTSPSPRDGNVSRMPSSA